MDGTATPLVTIRAVANKPALDCCLLSIHQLVDEIIIIDTGSVDDTVKIAEKYTSNIFF
ncbi:glycosyltransferase [Priestia flexa]|jgi:glycosyltransferase involved in cell wall biosynthesis|uniref:glycosyltransferase n=1 Tax=Priestia flexa TaxID=86664 RepID=UPI0035B54C75